MMNSNTLPIALNNLDYQQQHFLGSGGFSEVFKVIINDKQYALKKIHPSILKDPRFRQSILRQIDIMKQIDHPNIVKFYLCIQSNDYQANLLLQYMEGGSLYQQKNIYGKISQEQTKVYLKDIIKALKYLHSKSPPILHRDIKPQNILLTKNGQCKLADFGSSNILDGQRNTFAGTQLYMAPQIINSQSYNQAVDVWCVGVLLHELIVGKTPSYNQNGQIQIPPFVSRPAEDVIKKLLNKDPVLRMTLQQLQNHIWLVQSYQLMDKNLIFKKAKTIQQDKQAKHKFQSPISSFKSRLIAIKEKNKQVSEFTNSKVNQIKQKKIDAAYSSGTKTVETGFMSNLKQEKQALNKHSEQYIALMRHKMQLKCQIIKQKQVINKTIDIFKVQKFYKLDQITRIQSKVKEYTQNIELLKKSPLKFDYETIQSVEQLFVKKLDYLYQYVEYLPKKLQQQILDIPDVRLSHHTLPIGQYIFKLKTYMLQCKRDALIQLLAIKKRHISIKQMSMIEDAEENH